MTDLFPRFMKELIKRRTAKRPPEAQSVYRGTLSKRPPEVQSVGRKTLPKKPPKLQSVDRKTLPKRTSVSKGQVGTGNMTGNLLSGLRGAGRFQDLSVSEEVVPKTKTFGQPLYQANRNLSPPGQPYIQGTPGIPSTIASGGQTDTGKKARTGLFGSWGQPIGGKKGLPLDLGVTLAGMLAHSIAPNEWGGRMGKNLADLGGKMYGKRMEHEITAPERELRKRLTEAQIKKTEKDPMERVREEYGMKAPERELRKRLTEAQIRKADRQSKTEKRLDITERKYPTSRKMAAFDQNLNTEFGKLEVMGGNEFDDSFLSPENKGIYNKVRNLGIRYMYENRGTLPQDAFKKVWNDLGLKVVDGKIKIRNIRSEKTEITPTIKPPEKIAETELENVAREKLSKGTGRDFEVSLTSKDKGRINEIAEFIARDNPKLPDREVAGKAYEEWKAAEKYWQEYKFPFVERVKEIHGLPSKLRAFIPEKKERIGRKRKIDYTKLLEG